MGEDIVINDVAGMCEYLGFDPRVLYTLYHPNFSAIKEYAMEEIDGHFVLERIGFAGWVVVLGISDSEEKARQGLYEHVMQEAKVLQESHKKDQPLIRHCLGSLERTIS